MKEFILQHIVEIQIHGRENVTIGLGHDRTKSIVETIRVALRLQEELNRNKIDSWSIELKCEITEHGNGRISESEERNILSFWDTDFGEFRHPLTFLVLDEEEEARESLDTISDILKLEAPESVRKILKHNHKKCFGQL